MSTVPVSDANEFPFWRRFLGVLVGFIVGVIVVALIEGISLKAHPFPSDLNPDDQEAMRTFMEGLPMKTFVLVLVAHGAGSFIAGFG